MLLHRNTEAQYKGPVANVEPPRIEPGLSERDRNFGAVRRDIVQSQLPVVSRDYIARNRESQAAARAVRAFDEAIENVRQ